MSNTKTEAQRLADALEKDKWHVTAVTLSLASDELRRLDAIEQRYNEMMTNPCPEWDGKAYMQAIANLRAQLSKAVAEEREACAKVCESEPERLRGDGIRAADQLACAAAIRARSNT